jgi:hypothetical protein
LGRREGPVVRQRRRSRVILWNHGRIMLLPPALESGKSVRRQNDP